METLPSLPCSGNPIKSEAERWILNLNPDLWADRTPSLRDVFTDKEKLDAANLVMDLEQDPSTVAGSMLTTIDLTNIITLLTYALKLHCPDVLREIKDSVEDLKDSNVEFEDYAQEEDEKSFMKDDNTLFDIDKKEIQNVELKDGNSEEDGEKVVKVNEQKSEPLYECGECGRTDFFNYNYLQNHCYGQHIWRNPEAEKLLKAEIGDSDAGNLKISLWLGSSDEVAIDYHPIKGKLAGKVNSHFYCNACGDRSLTNIADLRIHFKKNHIFKPDYYKCPHCERTLSKKRLPFHIEAFHTDKGLPFQCSKCIVSFKSEKMLKTHMTKEHAVNSFHCQQCPSSFATESNLFNHLRTQHKVYQRTGRTNRLCQVCGKVFPNAARLRRHVAIIHADKRDYACKLCGMCFKEGRTMRNHVKAVHEKQRDFKCDICSRAFFKSYKLKQHVREVHQGIKEFECKICGKEFAQKVNMQTHVKKHHPN